MLPSSRMDRVKIWLITAVSVGAFICAMEALKSCSGE